jgi:hypothetical protein
MTVPRKATFRQSAAYDPLLTFESAQGPIFAGQEQAKQFPSYSSSGAIDAT